jgi:hypothetical protein
MEGADADVTLLDLLPRKFLKDHPIFSPCARFLLNKTDPTITAAEEAARTVYKIPLPEIIIIQFVSDYLAKIKCLSKYNPLATREYLLLQVA